MRESAQMPLSYKRRTLQYRKPRMVILLGEELTLELRHPTLDLFHLTYHMGVLSLGNVLVIHI